MKNDNNDTIEHVSDHFEADLNFEDEIEGISDVRLSDAVIAVCAVNSTLRTKGVAGLTSRFIEAITQRLGNTSLTRGIKVSQDNKGNVVVDVYVLVEYGYKIPEVAFNIQNNVKQEIENMTERQVTKVDIHVQGVVRPR